MKKNSPRRSNRKHSDTSEPKNSRPNSPASRIQNPEPEEWDAETGAQRVYTDIYSVGSEKGPIFDKNGKNKKYRQNTTAPHPAFTRLLSSQEFLQAYNALYPKGENRVDSAKDQSPVKSPRKPQKSENPDLPKRGKNVGSEPGFRGKSVGVRVIGGKFKALKLEYGGDHRVRPMKDRIREAVFNLIGTFAAGKHAVDLFAGTGALAFEALSRGAVSATLIEVHFPTARIIQRNISRLEEKEPGISQRIGLKTTDIFLWGRNRASLSELPQNRPWLIFCSPPYDFYVERTDEMLELLRNLYEFAPNDSVFVIEADNRFDFDLLEVEILPKKRKSYPPAEIAVYIKSDAR